MLIKKEKYENDTHLFNKWSFELSDFQKHAIEGIHEKKHIIITAHTGSGKTLPAEFAIEHFIKSGKKVIYTAPIKALSNQKYRELEKEFGDVGLVTGDVSLN